MVRYCLVRMVPCLGLLIISVPPVCGELRIDGDRLHVATANIRMTFQGGDIVEITNRLTGERVAYGLQRRQPLTGTVSDSGEAVALRSDGWRRGHENAEGREAAQTVLHGKDYTMWVNVILDRETDDVAIGIWAESSGPGVSAARLGVRSLDLGVGSLIIPTTGGFEYAKSRTEVNLTLPYPSEWVAQMLIWQSREGGLVLYSRDDENRYKAICLTRRGDYIDLGLEARAGKPWARATSVPYVEWRINAYKGGWQVPASGYKRLMSFLRPRDPAPESRLWVGQIQKVVEVPDRADGSWLDQLTKTTVPARTLILLTDWHESGPPDYRMTYRASVFISKARERGFCVMVPVHLQCARPGYGSRSSGGAGESPGPNGPDELQIMNPASNAWRRTLLRELREAFAGTRPDALLLLDGANVVEESDGTSSSTGLEGLLTLLSELQSAFPDIVLGTDGLHELLLPYVRIAQRPSSTAKPGHPITDFLFGDQVLWFIADRAAPRGRTAAAPCDSAPHH